jgi:ubiquinone biosynthesis protein
MARRAFIVAVIVVRSLAPAALLAGWIALLRGKSAAKRYLYRRLVHTLEQLGPAFIKAGQILGTRRDILPPALCDELSILQDSLPALPPALARATFSAVYGDAFSSIFAQIDYHPLASGSIACVYRGRLRSGREVAIKLQRPRIPEIMATDLALVKLVGSLLTHLPPFRGVPVNDVLDHLCGAVEAQLDFKREGDALRRLRDNLSQVPRVWVPALVESASRDLALGMELIPSLDTETPNRCSKVLRKQFAASTLAATYRMLFVDGFVHCDMHPGNLYFTEHGQVVVLDAGFSVQLSDKMRRLFAEFFMNMSLGRGDRCAEIVIESSTSVRPDANLEAFTAGMIDLVKRSSGLPAKDFSLIAFAGEMFDLQRKFGMNAAPDLIFPLLSLLVIEGTIRDLDPDVDFQLAARPVLTQGVFGSRP